MSVPEAIVYVATGTGAISAVAGAVSAGTNLRSTRRASRPLVYGEAAYRKQGMAFRSREEYRDAPVAEVFVYLHNDGTGTAREVRCCLRDPGNRWRLNPIDPIRAIKPGESMPSEGGFGFPPPWTVHEEATEGWGVATRFQDLYGRTWETFNQRVPAVKPLQFRRVRRKPDW